MNLLNKLLFLLLIIIIPSVIIGQNKNSSPKFLFGIHGGGNISKLKNDTISGALKNVFLLSGGLSGRNYFSDNFSMELGVQYSQRGANTESAGCLRNTYIDLLLLGQFWAYDFLLMEGGIQYANLVQQEYKILDGTAKNGVKHIPISGYNSQIEFLVGAGIKLQRGIEARIKYTIPVSTLEYSNFQLNLNFIINYKDIPESKVKFKNLDNALKSSEYCQVLVLQRKKLTEIPPEVFKLDSLEELILDGNSIASLPPEIGQLTRLRKLSVKHNKLDSLPKEIGNLKNLEELYLEFNYLKFLPDEICNLTGLQYFYIGKNQLEELPLQLGNLYNLRELYLVGSGALLEIPYSITNMRKLELLKIDKNILLPIPYRPPNSFLKIIIE